MDEPVALIADTHFGVRNDSPIFRKAFSKFLDTVFFPKIKERGVKTIIHLGDLFDKRLSLNIETYNHFRTHFLERLVELDLELFVLVGNHDSYFENTLSVNSVNEVLGQHWHQKITIVDRPGHIYVPLVSNPAIKRIVLALPWLCEDNIEEAMKVIKTSQADIVVGHLEIAGTPNGARPYENGFKPSTFKRFKKVISGHIHHRSERGNITYLGAPYEMTWDDCGCPRGFGLMDITTGWIEFIDNPHRVHHVINYSKNADTDSLDVEGGLVRLIVEGDHSQMQVAAFVERLEKGSLPAKVEIEDRNIIILPDELEVEHVEVETETSDTLSIVNSYVDQMDGALDKKMLKVILEDAYKYAIEAD